MRSRAILDPMDCLPPGSLSMGFPRQLIHVGPFPPPGDPGQMNCPTVSGGLMISRDSIQGERSAGKREEVCPACGLTREAPDAQRTHLG